MTKQEGDINTKISVLQTRQEHFSETLSVHSTKISNSEDKIHVMELEQVKLKNFGKDIETMNCSLGLLCDDVKHIKARQQRNNFLVDGGNKIFWIVLSNSITFFLTIVVTIIAIRMQG